MPISRALREKIFKGYINRGNNGNDANNKDVVLKLVTLRLEKAKLMGYDDYASFVLEDRMAKTSDKVYALLDEIWKPALGKAKEELAVSMPNKKGRRQLRSGRLGLALLFRESEEG